MKKGDALAEAYEILGGLIDLYLSEGNPDPEECTLKEQDALQIGEVLAELKVHCFEYSQTLKGGK